MIVPYILIRYLFQNSKRNMNVNLALNCSHWRWILLWKCMLSSTLTCHALCDISWPLNEDSRLFCDHILTTNFHALCDTCRSLGKENIHFQLQIYNSISSAVINLRKFLGPSLGQLCHTVWPSDLSALSLRLVSYSSTRNSNSVAKILIHFLYFSSSVFVKLWKMVFSVLSNVRLICKKSTQNFHWPLI